MLERLFTLDRCLIEGRATPDNRGAVIFFHGFPAFRGKNEDLIEAVHKNTQSDCFLLHYQGLGKSQGRFRFHDTLVCGEQLVREVQSRGYDHIDIVAHSWGATVAINTLTQYDSGVRKLILLAPFLDIPSPAVAEAMLQHFYSEEPLLRDLVEKIPNLEDIEFIRQQKHPLDKLKELTVSLEKYVYQGTRDDESDPTVTRHIPQLTNVREFCETGDIHYFEDRAHLSKTVITWLQQ